jgi:DNA-binding MarR family transcriptional regulator
MTKSAEYDLVDFTPYLLNQAAEVTSLAFQKHYKTRYGMLRTEWRVIFHLGKYGPMHAKDICTRARIHKTKVSRAVAALEQKRFLSRDSEERDRRQEILSLTRHGQGVFQELFKAAQQFDAKLMRGFSADEQDILKRCLIRIADL